MSFIIQADTYITDTIQNESYLPIFNASKLLGINISSNTTPNNGNTGLGASAIAIGNLAGSTSQDANSIVINATGSALENTITGSTKLSPIRENPAGLTRIYTLQYSKGNNEVFFDTAKTFVIQHSVEEEKYLVHACLEGPEAGVYYRGNECYNSA